MAVELKPTASQMAQFGNLSTDQLVNTFIDLANKAYTWMVYLPKATAAMPATSVAKKAAASLVSEGKAFQSTINAIIDQARKLSGGGLSGIDDPNIIEIDRRDGLGFLPAIAAVGTYVVGAVAASTAFRYTLVAACGYLYAWIQRSMSAEKSIQAEKAKIADAATLAVETQKAKSAAAIELKQAGLSDKEIASVLGEATREKTWFESITGIEPKKALIYGGLAFFGWKVLEKIIDKKL